MRRCVLPLLLLVALPLRADDPGRSAVKVDTEERINFASLTPCHAARLKGRRCVFEVEVDPTAIIEIDFPGQMVCDCVQSDPDLKWEAILPRHSKVKRGATLVVEGKVYVIRYSDTGKLSGLTIAADKVR